MSSEVFHVLLLVYDPLSLVSRVVETQDCISPDHNTSHVACTMQQSDDFESRTVWTFTLNIYKELPW